MNIFHLVSNGERSVITSSPEILERELGGKWAPRAEPTEQATWIEAKREFGFELTPLQQQLLGKTPEEAARITRAWVWGD